MFSRYIHVENIYVVLNTWIQFLMLKTKEDILKNFWRTKQLLLVPVDFHSKLKKCYGSQWGPCLIPAFFKISYFMFNIRKKLTKDCNKIIGWVNNYKMFIFGWTITLIVWCTVFMYFIKSRCSHTFGHVLYVLFFSRYVYVLSTLNDIFNKTDWWFPNSAVESACMFAYTATNINAKSVKLVFI